jgi:hypothetical protein
MKSSFAFLFLAFLAIPAFTQQMPAYTEAGPVPPGITNAKTIFVSNAGSDGGLFPEPFSGDESRAYTEFFAALLSSKQFKLVSDPSQADIVLELRLTAPYGPTNANKINGAADPLPQFRLVVYDGKTHFILWTITRPIEVALLQKTHDKNFDDALSAVLTRFLTIAHGPSSAPTPPPTQ